MTESRDRTCNILSKIIIIITDTDYRDWHQDHHCHRHRYHRHGEASRLIPVAGHYQGLLLGTHQELIWLITPPHIHPSSSSSPLAGEHQRTPSEDPLSGKSRCTASQKTALTWTMQNWNNFLRESFLGVKNSVIGDSLTHSLTLHWPIGLDTPNPA